MKRKTKTVQKPSKYVKMAEKRKKTIFFLTINLIFTKIIVTLPKNFSEEPIK